MQQHKILLVDTDNSAVDILAVRLALRGFNAHVAYNANMTLDKLRKRNPPGVVVLSAEMLAMSDFKLLQSIRKLYPQMQIIMSSTQDHYVQMAGRVPAKQYAIIKKPIDINELIFCVSVGFIQQIERIEERLKRFIHIENSETEQKFLDAFNDIQYYNKDFFKF